MKKTSILILCLFFIFVSCNSTKEVEGNWITTSFVKDGIAQEIAVSNIEFTAKGNAVNAGGCAGVNLFNGNVKLSNGKINLNNIAVTKMMGDPAAMEFEDMFIELLNNADSYLIEGNNLIIKASSKNLELQLKKEK